MTEEPPRALPVHRDPPARRVTFGRPPVDGTDEEIEEWARAFVEAMLGPPDDGEEPTDAR